MFEKIKAIIANQLFMDVNEATKLTLDTKLVSDLGVDGIDALEIVIAIEDQYDIIIPDEATESWVTIGDIIKYLETKV